MIEAAHSRLARKIFNPYLSWLIRRNFSHFYMCNTFNPPKEKCVLVITPNHISWWDGFFIDFVARNFIPGKMFLMILESTLTKYPFFRKLGAFSINNGYSTSLLKTLRYSADVLKNPDNFLVMYPQGEIEPYEKRPLNIKQGIKLFVKNIESPVYVLPIAFKVELYNEKKPAVVCRFGQYISKKSLLDNFDGYLAKFYENLNSLSEAAYKKEFKLDLLE